MPKPPDGHTVACMGIAMTSRNRGVLALGSSLLGLIFRSQRAANAVYLIGHNRHETIPITISGSNRLLSVIPARMSPRARLTDHLFIIVICSIIYRITPIKALRKLLAKNIPWIGAARSAVIVGDIRGGDSFSDIYGLGRFLNGFFMAWSVILIRGEIIQFPQTYGPYRSFVARILARFLLSRSSTVIARDKESQRVAQDLVGSSKSIVLSPDVAFSLEPIVPKLIECQRASDLKEPSTEAPLKSEFIAADQLKLLRPIGINVNGLMFNGGYTRNNQFGLTMDYAIFLPRMLEALLHHSSKEIWLIPHTYGTANSVESDPEACLRVHAALAPELRSRVRIVTGDYNCHELKGIIGLCDFFIGSRMHSCIAALSQGIPCVGIAYSMKFRGVFESVGLADWVVDARNTSDSDGIFAIIDFFEKRETVRASLSAAAMQARAGLYTLFEALLAKPRENSI